MALGFRPQSLWRSNATLKINVRCGLALGSGAAQEHDYVSAHKWLNSAAAGEDDAAAEKQDSLAAKMTEQSAEAQRQAREWKSTSSVLRTRSRSFAVDASDPGRLPPTGGHAGSELFGQSLPPGFLLRTR